MRIFNIDKITELNKNEIDFTKGHLVDDKLLIKHVNSMPEIKEQGHYETVAEYPNGGKDTKWVVDVVGVPAVQEHDEYEEIQIFVPFTKQEIIQKRIDELKNQLAQFDYIGIKIATGRATKDEYATQINQMIMWTNEINELQKQI